MILVLHVLSRAARNCSRWGARLHQHLTQILSPTHAGKPHRAFMADSSQLTAGWDFRHATIALCSVHGGGGHARCGTNTGPTSGPRAPGCPNPARRCVPRVMPRAEPAPAALSVAMGPVLPSPQKALPRQVYGVIRELATTSRHSTWRGDEARDGDGMERGCFETEASSSAPLSASVA